MFEPEIQFESSYRLKPYLLDENEVSVFKLRKTIVMVFEKSRAGAEKKFPPNALKKKKKLLIALGIMFRNMYLDITKTI